MYLIYYVLMDLIILIGMKRIGTLKIKYIVHKDDEKGLKILFENGYAG